MSSESLLLGLTMMLTRYAPIKRSGPPRKRRLGKPRRGPARDRRYRAFIRTQPCVCCGTTRNIEAAHTGSHGYGQKSSDFSCLPLCGPHHRTDKWAYHGLSPVIWAAHWQLDVPALIARFNRLYLAETGSVAA